VYQQKHKQEMLLRNGVGSSVHAEMKSLQEQLAEEAVRGKSLQSQKETICEQVFKLEQAIEQEKAQIAFHKQPSTHVVVGDSDDLIYYRSQLEKTKTKLAETTEHISVLNAQLEGEIRSNRALIDEAEADFLRQIARLNANLTT
jgi:hypothetical protein